MGHAWQHFKTITRHRRIVRQYCFRCGLYWQGLTHDLSKYSLTEFLPGARYYQGNRSPNAAQREAEGYSGAWLHHKGRNKHHYEYWYDIDPVTRTPVTGLGMPPKYIAEMVCDRIAACRVYYGRDYTPASAWSFYERTKSRMQLHPATDEILSRCLALLRDQGEEALFAHIRENVLKK